MEYEINYLILQSNTAELAKLRQEAEDLIKSCGCEILEKKEYLKRKLAYEINREGYGFHTVLRFKFAEDKKDIEGLKKKLNLNFKIARYLIIRPDGLSSLKDLEKKAEMEKTEGSVEKKSELKQEEVEKILAEEKKKEVISEDEAKEEKREEKKETVIDEKKEEKKDEIKKEDIEKVKKIEDDEKAPEEKEEEKKEDEKESDSKDDSKKEKEEDQTKEKKESKEKDKISLDDLDKKLDEILNI